ncbi:putative F-box/LRR-repeat protein 23 [Helianthus annuus]|uniref:putative F-box/LRR-repeat protein 23 n=1 Tax=Helianthus annuus TaxID=4232 RepID=UPI000B8FA78C|nr:putative F-box/LRR-repeat protein 23 [Helianthus annuus]
MSPLLTNTVAAINNRRPQPLDDHNNRVARVKYGTPGADRTNSGDILVVAANKVAAITLLEELNLYAIIISKEEIETVGRYCPMLKTLKVNSRGYAGSLMRYNEIAIAIGQNLLGIRHLELIGNKMTNVGLRVILDNCHHLETLDLRECFYIDLKGDLGKQCSKQIKYLKLPNDSLEGCPYLWIISKEDYQDSGDNNDGYDSYESY